MIYFARFPSGSIKIGHTTLKINIRISGLKTRYGVDVVLLKTMRGGIYTERKIHARFAHLRMHRIAEQFRPAPDLMEYIGVPDPEFYDASTATVQSVEIIPPGGDRKPTAERFAVHCVTLDAETLRIARSLIGTVPEIDSLSAVVRHVLRYHQARELETKKQEKRR